ncbi:MAG TPA: hypothetical protein VH144_03715, partial [Candidatus Saccharimonadales bacterium]|nr:hypothetical protein [Candidatus Saccharimonadales bacterium]
MKKETSVLKSQFDGDKKPKAAAKPVVQYINNPFMITVKGLEWLFNRAKTIAIILLVLSLFGVAGNVVFRSPNGVQQDQTKMQQDQSKFMHDFSHTIQSVSPEQWLTVGIIAIVAVLLFLSISFWLKGAAEYTAAHLAKGEEVSLKAALSGSWHKLGGYAWLQVLVGIKVFLWSLLLIVPGIIMGVRYSLAGVAFFAEDDLKGNKAIKRSLTLTKGGWITTFASNIVFNAITLGLVSSLTDIATTSVLY